MSVPVWVVGDWVTGRPLYEIPNVGPGSQFSADLQGSSATLELNPGDLGHRRLRGELRADMTRYVAALGSTEAQPLVALAGGPILAHEATPDEWRWQIGGPDAYPARRLLIAAADVQPTIGTTQPVYTLTGTWRQIVNQALALLPRAGRQMPPMAVTVGELAGGGSHEVTVEAVDLVTLADLLREISTRADGVETRCLPWWQGTSLEDGFLRVEIGVGQDDDRYVAGPTRIPITVGTRGGTVVASSWQVDASRRATSSWVSGGRGADEVIVQSWADWAALNAGVPPLDIVDSSTPNNSDRSALDWRAKDVLADAIAPAVDATLRFRVGSAPDPWSFSAGDWVDLEATSLQDMIPVGGYQMRVVSRSWRASDPDWVEMRLVGVRPTERW